MQLKNKFIVPPGIFSKIANYVIFYVGWSLCLRGALLNEPFIGPLFTLLVVLYHFTLFRFKRAEVILVLSLTLIGTLIDTIFLNVGLVSYRAGLPTFPWLAPLWVSSIWALLATCINHSLAWVNRSLPFAMVLGSGGGAASYFAAYRIGVCDFPPGPVISLFVIAIFWAFYLPGMFWWAKFLGAKSKK